MRRLRHAPVYNSRILQMLPFSRLRWFCCAVLFFSQLALAADWRKPVAQIAGKISAATGPGVIALEVTNRSSISAADVELIRRGITTELATAGVRVWQPEQAAATVKVTLSENLESYVWVAEIRQGTSEPTIMIVSADRPASTATAQAGPALNLHATSLFSQPDPILDVAVLEGSPRRALALSGSAVTIYVFQDNHWLRAQSLPISHEAPFPLDLRGRIVLRKDHLFDAYLPGVVCHSTDAGGLSMNCSRSDDPWPIGIDSGLSAFFAPARNFFTGVLSPGVNKQKSAPPFYSAAGIPKDKYMLWLFAGVDGQLHMLDGINQQTAGKLRWGSEIAGVRAPCRPDWFVLATSATDEEESVQAFEFPDRERVAVSQKMPISGVITALWTQQNGESVTAVYRSSETGDYEALQLTLTCSQ
jgi:hypothetical protein